ncbi:MAG TPA: glycosyltransferase family 39 protein [Candidatus Scatomorpha merdigallinarum]|nr:glycosyltransferase family 39 protein [Candidatus Scatomorpha merdigallinarum]
MGKPSNKLNTCLDAALAAAAAVCCAIMLRAGCAYVLDDPETRGWLIVLLGVVLALGICPLAAFLMRRGGEKALGIVVFLLAFALRAAYVLQADSVPASDFALEYDAALALANGDMSAFDTQYFTFWGYQIPFALYEALVIALGGGVTVLGLLNALWGALTALGVFVLAVRFAPRGAAFTAGALYALCPGAILLTPALTNQCIALFFFMLALWLYLGAGWQRALLAGAALGFGNLMRSEAAMLWCALLAALVLTLTARSEPMKKALVRFALLIAGFVLITAAVRGGIALSGIAPNGTGNSVPEWKLVLGLDTATLGRYDPNMEYLLYIEDGAQRQAAAMEAIRASLSSSEDLFGFFWEKAELFWGGYEESWLGVVNEYIYPLRFWDRVFFIAAALLALAGCFGLRESREETIARGAVFAMFCAYLLIEVQPRYRYFVWPFLLMLAAAGLGRLGKAFERLRASGHRRAESV